MIQSENIPFFFKSAVSWIWANTFHQTEVTLFHIAKRVDQNNLCCFWAFGPFQAQKIMYLSFHGLKYIRHFNRLETSFLVSETTIDKFHIRWVWMLWPKKGIRKACFDLNRKRWYEILLYCANVIVHYRISDPINSN